jgi:membrane-bound inhibitor of C-type lysozyme
MKRKWMCAAGFILLMVLWITAGTLTAACCGQDQEEVVVAVYVSSQREHLTARFDIAAKKVTIERPGRKTLTLPLAISASGARYSDGTMTFWEHRGTATLYKGDQVIYEGKELRL